MRPVSPGATSRSARVVEAHDRAARRAARGAGRGAQVLRRGDRRPRHLGRAVEVVEHVAEGVHDARRELARQRRAARGDDAQRAEVVACDRLRRRSSRIRWSITGTTTSAVRAVLVDRAAACPPGRSGGAGRASSRARSRARSARSPRSGTSARRSSCARGRAAGSSTSSAAAGSSDSGCLRVAPFGVPVVPLVRMTTRPCATGGTAGRAGSPRLDERPRARGAPGAAPSDHAT